MMDGVARHKDRFFDYTDFFAQAANGTLRALATIFACAQLSQLLQTLRCVQLCAANFVWIAPNNSYCDHPCHDVAKGERLTKDIYEAVRAGPGWEKTLFAVLYDDAGGLYDHVVPPFAQTDDAPCNVGNRPGPGPPPAADTAFAKPLRPGRHTGLGYELGARLLTADERARGMAGRSAPPLLRRRAAGAGTHRSRHNATSDPPPAPSSTAGERAREPPELDGQQWTLLNTYRLCDDMGSCDRDSECTEVFVSVFEGTGPLDKNCPAAESSS
jgi:hypothetical protein